jgi:hypothetical protein
MDFFGIVGDDAGVQLPNDGMRGVNLGLCIEEDGELANLAASAVVAWMIMVVFAVMMRTVGGSMMRVVFDAVKRFCNIRQHEDTRKHPHSKSLICSTFLHFLSTIVLQNYMKFSRFTSARDGKSLLRRKDSDYFSICQIKMR